MKMVPRIVRVRMAVPPTLPGILCMHLPIMEFEIVVCVPANCQLCFVDGCRIVGWWKYDLEFEMAACALDILPRLKTRESTKWILRLRVSSGRKDAFAWSVEGCHRIMTDSVLFSA